MSTHILKEHEWGDFIEKEIFSLITKQNSAKVFALVGDLGAGKTTFSKILLKKLGVKEHVQSPTFSIINSYSTSFANFEKVFHIDVYRIEDIKELEVLHIDEIINSKNNIVIIEWADKIKTLIPENAVWIYFEHDTLETRKITLTHD